MESQLLSSLLQLIAAILFPILAVFARQAVQALKTQASAHISAEKRDIMYAAVKLGLRKAEAEGITIDGVAHQAATGAIEVAQRYLAGFGIQGVSSSFLLELMGLEAQKQKAQDAVVESYSAPLSYEPAVDIEALANSVAERVAGLLSLPEQRTS